MHSNSHEIIKRKRFGWWGVLWGSGLLAGLGVGAFFGLVGDCPITSDMVVTLQKAKKQEMRDQLSIIETSSKQRGVTTDFRDVADSYCDKIDSMAANMMRKIEESRRRDVLDTVVAIVALALGVFGLIGGCSALAKLSSIAPSNSPSNPGTHIVDA